MTTTWTTDNDMTTIIDTPCVDGCVTPRECAELRTEFKEMAKAFTLLASYAEAKENAMCARQYGKIALAMKFEAACESVYKQLPQWAKW